MSKTKIKPMSRKSDLVIQELEKETLIYDLIIDKAFSLNETSSLIWNLCDGENSISDIAAKLSRQVNSSINEDFIWLALDQLKTDNLIETEDDFSFLPIETTRRDMIRKVGLASLITLPIVASLMAPTAAHAQSNCAAASGRSNNCTCTANGQCGSMCCGTNGVAPTCVAGGLDPQGSPCRAGCECVSNCCVGLTCQNGEIPAGSGTCTTACQCASNSCNTATGICN